MPTLILNPTDSYYIDRTAYPTTTTVRGQNLKMGGGTVPSMYGQNAIYVPHILFDFNTLPQDTQIESAYLNGNVVSVSEPMYFQMHYYSIQTHVESTGLQKMQADDVLSNYMGSKQVHFEGWNINNGFLEFANNMTLEINYKFIPPIAPTSPISATSINRFLVNRLSWTNTSAQASSSILWSTDDFVTTHTIVGGSNPYIDVPAGTFSLGSVKWKVKIVGTNGLESLYSPVASFTSTETALPPPINLTPTGNKDKYKSINFNWDGGAITGARYEIQYNINNTGWIVLAQNLSANNITVPANTFAIGELQWKVRTTATTTQVSDWSSTATINIIEVPPPKPINLNPTGDLDKYKEVLFTWNNEVGIVATKFEFEYSQDNAQTWIRKTEYSSNTTTKIPANTFALGSLLWRVRITDNNGLISEYSTNASCNVILYPPKKPINLSPASGSINKDLENRFSWDNDGAQQSKFTFSYSQNAGANWTDVVINTTNNYYDITANTLVLGTLLWKVKIADSNGVESEYSSQVSVSVVETVIVKPAAPVNLIPSDTNINLADIVRFSWYTAETQKDFTLAYSNDGGLNYNTIVGTTPNKYVDIPSNTFIKGTLLWKVKYTAERNVTSEYSSQATVNVISKPTTPIIDNITIDGTSTNIKWISELQASYQLQILKASVIVLDTLEVSSSSKSYSTPLVLENNISYVFRLRIKNAYGLWSDWAETSFFNKFVAPSTPTFSIYNSIDRLQININNPNIGEEVLYNNVYRSEDGVNFIRVATDVINTYTDYKIKNEKAYYYKVQAISEFGSAWSVVKGANVKLSNAQLISTDTNKLVNIKYNIKQNISYRQDVSLMQFAGRKKLVSEFSNNDAQVDIAIDFKIVKQDELNNLEDIFNSKEVCLYRDNRGKKVYCTVNSYGCEDGKGKTFNVSIIMSEVNYTEEV